MMEQLNCLTDPSDPLYQNYGQFLELEERTGCLKDFPLLRGLLDRVKRVEGIGKWLQTRPKNEEENF